jgi:predicted flap endonuclease-1-like 5' DNA nuclease
MSNPGGTRDNHFMAVARRAGIEARQTRAAERAANLAPIVRALQADGVTSLKGIAKALNDRGVLTPAGRAHWHAMQVARVLKRLAG